MRQIPKLLRSRGIETYGAYFDLIIESVINGQNRQAVEQYRQLPRDRKLSFYFHLNSCGDKIFNSNLFLFLRSEFDKGFLE